MFESSYFNALLPDGLQITGYSSRLADFAEMYCRRDIQFFAETFFWDILLTLIFVMKF